jgi:hypothetical protein
MIKRRRLFLLIAFTFLCAWLGFRAATFAQGREQIPLPGNYPPGVPYYGAAPLELKMLFLEVDSLANPINTRLNSAWLMVNNPTLSAVYWFPLYPFPTFKEGQDKLFQEFHLEANRMPSSSFLAEVQRIYKIEWDSILVIDRNDLIYIMSPLNGIKTNELNIDSYHIFSIENIQNSQDTLTQYAKVLRAICQSRNEMVSYPTKLESLVNKFADRLRPSSSIEPATFNQIVSRFKELFIQQQPLPCEFVGIK